MMTTRPPRANPAAPAIRAGRVSILGCPVDSLTLAEAAAWVAAGVAAHSNPALVVAMNANKYWLISRDRRLRQIVAAADLIIPEYAVVWAGRVLGTPVKAHVGGIMLFQTLLDEADSRAYRVYFLGARPRVIEAMVSRLKREQPALQIAGWHHGYFQGRDDQILDSVRASRADILFAALGTPYQEYWLSDNLQRLGVPVALGVGGSFDVAAGAKRDAPAWARGRGLEWLYRLWQEPRAYWKRYAVANPWFVYQVLRARVWRRPGASHGRPRAP